MEDLSSLQQPIVYISTPYFKRNYKFNVNSNSSVNSSFILTTDQPKPSSKFSNTRVLNNVRTLKIRINKTYQGKPVCLGRVEVWGDPSSYICSDDVLNRVKLQFSQLVEDTTNAIVTKQAQPKKLAFKPLPLFSSMPPTTSDVSTNTTHNNNNNISNILQEYEIPAEYFDPITCELMQDPVVLPSGHIVDMATITRHLAMHKNNPFTAVPLRIEEVVAHNRLKTEIASYIQIKKRKRFMFENNSNNVSNNSNNVSNNSRNNRGSSSSESNSNSNNDTTNNITSNINNSTNTSHVNNNSDGNNNNTLLTTTITPTTNDKGTTKSNNERFTPFSGIGYQLGGISQKK